ncbi:hypothetical protein [Acidocella aminolytica]|uniref:Phage-related membrane protein n=1 Tax=Acidocella aminolytica 101 = DSM 11237 TaxID=1120923 RepID=A0A0D6PMY2_9PROT|nr:hypothetical protein [Acidocella aminolytica]GAN82154.1 hypothetical protein Aam_169_002 [Acidocella aminolytica 101 = DSM 11237]GBQ44978.1 phage-related membrane protein [Acidocella aminolytica 101 = DSM 11237]SHF53126.1 hypothetical protein SAMN02746095_03607 [Acidocella aminolytica 101 = DSM 11237]
MPRLRFEQLLGLYRDIDFDPQGNQGSLNLLTVEQIADLQLIESDDSACEDANLSVLSDPSTLAIGQKVRVHVGSPRISLGLLVRSVDDLLKTPEARITEPAAYFVVDGRIEPQTSPTPTTIAAYRKVLAIVALFSKAAAYLDQTRQELVFVHEGKVVVPVRYDVAVLDRISQAAIDALLENFKDDVHQDQKLAILENAIVQMVEARPSPQRFTYILDNLDALLETVRQGYRLFASSFSYTKIRGEVEAAKADYVAKIHKTLIDIQGQLLGIPVATIIVASQLKSSQTCGVEFWTNVAVVAGAWVFLALLIIAIINQWVTLGAIDDDIKSQRQRLEKDYAAISSQFISIYRGLANRVSWHRKALIGIGAIAVVGAFFATFAFSQLNTAPFSCFIGASPITQNLSKPKPLPAMPASRNKAHPG